MMVADRCVRTRVVGRTPGVGKMAAAGLLRAVPRDQPGCFQPAVVIVDFSAEGEELGEKRGGQVIFGSIQGKLP